MAPKMQSTRREILTLLKTRGGLTVKELSEALGITSMGVRQHLATLERDGYVIAQEMRRGRGRPSQIYSLSRDGDELFPRSYGALALSILEDVAELDGEDHVDRLFEHRTKQTAAVYRERLAGATFPDKVRELARIRDEEGYLAELHQVDENTFTLIEHNCAIHDVANRFPQICSYEMQLFAELLGAEVTREQRIVDGDARCAYNIRPKQTSES